MILTRRAAGFLLAFAAWNLYVWVTFVWNVYPQHHWDAFFIVHLLIGAATSAMGGVVGLIGWRGLRHKARA